MSGHAKKGCHPVVISLKIKLPVVMVLICLFSFQVIHKNEFESLYTALIPYNFVSCLSFFLPQLLLHISQSSFSVDLNERMFNWFLRAIVLFFVVCGLRDRERSMARMGKRRLYLTNFCLKDNLRLNVMDLWIFER